MAEFANKNSRQASTMMSLLEALLGYHPQIIYEDNCDFRSKSWLADENTAALCNLMKELKKNLAKSPKQ